MRHWFFGLFGKPREQGLGTEGYGLGCYCIMEVLHTESVRVCHQAVIQNYCSVKKARV